MERQKITLFQHFCFDFLHFSNMFYRYFLHFSDSADIVLNHRRLVN